MKGGFDFPSASRRSHKRISCALAVRWTYGDAVGLGYASNLSFNGFCLRTRQLPAPGFAAEFILSSKWGDVEVRARVVWTRQLQVESHVNAWHEMGLELEGGGSPEYLELLKKTDKPPIERREHSRVSHSMSVRFKCGRQTFTASSLDVSRRGLLILCDSPPDVGDRISVILALPGTTEPVTLRADVVRHVDYGTDEPHKAFAVRFHGLGAGEERMFINYLKIVRELHCIGSSLG